MEKVLGERVRSLRRARGWSQEELARRMAQHGFPAWRQTTVAKTEAAERPIRVNEVYGLARVFEESVTGLLTEPDRGGDLHALLVALDAERVAEAVYAEAVDRLTKAEEALDAARAGVALAQERANRGEHQ